MASQSTLDAAHQILRDAVAGVPDDGWQRPTPCTEWNVAQVAEHAAMDQLLYVASITGGEKPAGDAFAPTGALDEPVPSFVDRAIQASKDAFGTVAAEAEQVGVPLPPFAMPAPLAFGSAALDAAVHGWDVAVATGQDPGISEELARELLAVARQIVEPVRGWGAYATAIESPAAAGDLASLLHYLGRQPDWRP